MTTKDTTKTEETMLVGGLAVAAEGGSFGSPARVLLSVLHLLEEEGSLFLVDKRKAGEAVFDLEAMKEGAILVVGPCVEDLLVPNYSPVRRLFNRSVSISWLTRAAADRIKGACMGNGNNDLPKCQPS